MHWLPMSFAVIRPHLINSFSLLKMKRKSSLHWIVFLLTLLTLLWTIFRAMDLPRTWLLSSTAHTKPKHNLRLGNNTNQCLRHWCKSNLSVIRCHLPINLIRINVPLSPQRLVNATLAISSDILHRTVHIEKTCKEISWWWYLCSKEKNISSILIIYRSPRQQCPHQSFSGYRCYYLPYSCRGVTSDDTRATGV